MNKKCAIFVFIFVSLRGFVVTNTTHTDPQITAYLERLGFISSIPKTSLSFLETLQTNHIHTFSHDTIDCYFKRPISLEPKKIIAKFLLERRGGLCFELNGAFFYLLKYLGFDAILVSSHVHRVGKRTYNFNIDTHVVIITTINKKRYLVDVGFADSCRTPIKLDDNGTIKDISGSYKVIAHSNFSYGLYKYLSGEWLLQYTFTLQPCELGDFQNNLNFVYNSSEHEFSNNLFCTRSTLTGHLALLCLIDKPKITRKFLIKDEHGYKKLPVATFAKVQDLLITQFGMSEEMVNSLVENIRTD